MEQVEIDFNTPANERNHPWWGLLDAQIVADFWVFHDKHPQVFDLFLKYAREALAAGRERFGAAMIIQRIRWYVRVERVGTQGETFKINDHVGACYARLTMIRYPEFEGLFELRSSNRMRREDEE